MQEPAGAEMAAAMERMKDLGVLMGKGGLHGSCFRIMCACKSMHLIALQRIHRPWSVGDVGWLAGHARFSLQCFHAGRVWFKTGQP
jgi:hypothetical protein